MSNPVTTHPTLASVFWPKTENKKALNLLTGAVLAFAGSLLLTLSAKISVPFYPVPMTMQTLVVLGLGMALGSRLGVAAVMLYMFEGAMGFPVFSGTPEKGMGVAYMMGPTGGYLLGFVVAAWVTGFLAERGWDRGFVSTASAMVIGNGVIYAFGLLWLGSILGWDKPIIEWGMTPFLLGDLTKVLLAAIIMPTVWKMVGKPKD